jgi:hypothetical protein
MRLGNDVLEKSGPHTAAQEVRMRAHRLDFAQTSAVILQRTDAGDRAG